MSPATATLIGAGVVIIVNLLTAAYVYGQLTQKVKNHGGRIQILETTVSGPGGQGERISRLESTRAARAHHGD